MSDKPILIGGAGPGGKAMAAYLASLGYVVNLYNRTHKNISYIKADNKLYIEYIPRVEEHLYHDLSKRINFYEEPDKDGLKRGSVKLNKVSSNMGEAFKDDPDLIMVVVPARGHKYYARKMAKYLRDGHTVLLNPGRMFGALEFRNELKKYYAEKKGKMPDITVGETETLIYACRTGELQEEVRIFGVKRSVNFATIPQKNAKNVLSLIVDAYPQFNCELEDGELMNVAKTTFGNVGGVLHVPTTISNANLISHPDPEKKKFEFYYDGTVAPATTTLIKAVDRERVKLAESMGVEVDSLRKWIERVWEGTGLTLSEAIKHVKAYQGIMAPEDLNTRYLWEDVPDSLVPLNSMGKKIGIESKVTEACITFAELYLHEATALEEPVGKSILKYGRTMESLGLDKLEKEQIKEYLKTGENPIGDI